MTRHLARVLMLLLAAVQVSMGTPRTAGAVLCFGDECHQPELAAESICASGCSQHDDGPGAFMPSHHVEDCSCIDVEVPELRFRTGQRDAVDLAVTSLVVSTRWSPAPARGAGLERPTGNHAPPELAAMRTVRLLV